MIDVAQQNVKESSRNVNYINLLINRKNCYAKNPLLPRELVAQKMLILGFRIINGSIKQIHEVISVQQKI